MLKYVMPLCIALCFSVLAVHAGEISVDPNAPSYHNARYGFSLAWPPGQYAVAESDNGDGITVTDGKGLTLRAWGALEQDVFDLSLEEFFKRAQSADAQYAKINREKRWYVVSGMREKSIYYRKSFYTDEAVVTLDIEYPAERKHQYDKFVSDSVKTFMP